MFSYSYSRFLTEEDCLRYMFESRRSTCHCGSATYYPVKGRKSFVCSNGHQFYPLKNTIFEHSHVPLTRWFFVIYLFSVSKNGLAATEIQRHLGVTYKTAHRMGHQVRKLMRPSGEMIGGTGVIVEADETYIGGRPRKRSNPYRFTGYRGKRAVLGVVERGGEARAKVEQYSTKKTIQSFLRSNLMEQSVLHTDESPLYKWTKEIYYHDVVNHSLREYSRDRVTTNTIEGFWSQLKRSLDGTYHVVSTKYLQLYVDEFVFRYNNRRKIIFHELLARC